MPTTKEPPVVISPVDLKVEPEAVTSPVAEIFPAFVLSPPIVIDFAVIEASAPLVRVPTVRAVPVPKSIEPVPAALPVSFVLESVVTVIAFSASSVSLKLPVFVIKSAVVPIDLAVKVPSFVRFFASTTPVTEPASPPVKELPFVTITSLA